MALISGTDRGDISDADSVIRTLFHPPGGADQPLSHSASQSLSHSGTQALSHSHSVTQPLSHTATQSLSHPATQPLSHSTTQSLSHSVTQPLSHSVTQPLSHSGAFSWLQKATLGTSLPPNAPQHPCRRHLHHSGAFCTSLGACQEVFSSGFRKQR